MWPSLRSAILAYDRDQILGEVRTLEDLIDSNVRVRRSYTWLLAAFAAIGALLVAIGLHASLAFTVAQRMREIGIRIALGAQPLAIARLLAGSVTPPVIAGLFAGIGAGAAAMRVFASLIYGDRLASSFATAGLLVLLLVVFAAAQPVLSGLRLNPSEALRVE